MPDKRPVGRPKGTPNPNGGRKAKDPDNPLTERLFTLVSAATAQEFHQARGAKTEADALREAVALFIASVKEKDRPPTPP